MDQISESSLLIIRPRPDVYIKPQVLDQIREEIMEQKEEGVILIPSFFEVIAAPKDVTIKVEGEDLPNEQRS